MLGSVLFYLVVSIINHNISKKYYSEKLITKGIRKTEDYSGVKNWILFVVNTMQVGLMVYFAMKLYQNGGTSLYMPQVLNISEVALFFLQILFIMFVFDTNFYWLHRFAHKRSVFKYLHMDHHHYKFPTAWSSSYMGPHDMLLTTALPVLWVVLLGVPISLPAYFVALLMTNYINIVGHDGYEVSGTLMTLTSYIGWAAYIDPKRKWISRLFNTVTHHDLHHQKVVYNFSLYFTFWVYKEAIGETE
jgi:sterol desaturase/sphingolipid hydroxylase (fatty acid hydroxylase superfamily)